MTTAMTEVDTDAPERLAMPPFRLFLVRRVRPLEDVMVQAHGFGLMDNVVVFTELVLELRPGRQGPEWVSIPYQRRAFRDWTDVEEVPENPTGLIH